MKMKICFALTVAGGLAACSLHAAGTLIAAATIEETGTSGSEFMYSLTLTNAGSNPINAFWYGWIQGHFDLPSNPTSITAPTGWSGTADNDSVQFANNTGSAIPAGGVATFTFETTFDPSAMTSGTTGGTATGNSVAYATVAAMQGFEQSVAGIASAPFVPTLQTAGTLTATATLTETGTSGSAFNYSLTLNNTGSNAINAFWYGWIQGHFDLPGNPTNITAPTGWSGNADNDSVQFANNTGSAIPAGGSGTFTFETTFDPTAMTSGTTGGTSTGNSVAYGTVAAMQGFEENVAGVASAPFVPTLQTIPAPNFQAPLVVAGAIQLTWASLPGIGYQVQFTTNLGQTNWSNLGSVITATNNPTTTNVVIGSDSQLFYRVEVLQ
jgi:hypothetical protein